MGDFRAIIPAAGASARFGAAVPKQFHTFSGRTMLDHSIAAVLADERIAEVHVAVAADGVCDAQPGRSLPAGQRARVHVHGCGQSTRARTVLAAATAMAAGPEDWLVVHDAARPCLHRADLSGLLDVVAAEGIPALLAEPLAHTLKQAANKMVERTVDRQGKWLAQTPQVAPAGLLLPALQACPDATDEAQALEMAGVPVRLVEARHLNPKVTYQADLELADIILTRMQTNAT